MEKITITIETGNAAFGDDPAFEVSRILSTIIDDLGWGLESRKLRDINGNIVGSVVIEGP